MTKQGEERRGEERGRRKRRGAVAVWPGSEKSLLLPQVCACTARAEAFPAVRMIQCRTAMDFTSSEEERKGEESQGEQDPWQES